MQETWQARERKAALLTLASPLLVAIVTALALTPIFSTDAIYATPLIAVVAYVSLLLFVMPLLKLLQRLEPLERVTFGAIVAVAGTAPWLVLYLVFFAAPDSAKYGGAPRNIALLLVPPLAAAFLVSYLLHPYIRQEKQK